VTLATGTQTGGSVIRPAAFCGITGYKPTFGHFPIAGMKANTEWLDTIGAYARSVEDIALFRAALMAIPFRPIAKLDTPPRIAVCYTPHKGELQDEAVTAIRDAAAAFAKAGARVTEIDLPSPVNSMREGQKTLSAFDGPRAHADDARRFHDLLSKSLREDKLAAGAKIDYATWVAARQLGERGRAAVDGLFTDIDVILTPPAKGEAPLGLERTGDATFNLLWTFLWMPCVTLPFARGPNGLPVGIQLVGRQHEDARLLDIAAWAKAALT
jgi:Asp-tRNA(Asn)/Glu-tRNA(Gln) amidotransferase A subunit family amidase